SWATSRAACIITATMHKNTGTPTNFKSRLGNVTIGKNTLPTPPTTPTQMSRVDIAAGFPFTGGSLVDVDDRSPASLLALIRFPSGQTRHCGEEYTLNTRPSPAAGVSRLVCDERPATSPSGCGPLRGSSGGVGL